MVIFASVPNGSLGDANRRRFALTQGLLAEVRRARDAGEDRQFAIDNPRGLSVRVRAGEAAFYVQSRGPNGIKKRKLSLIGEIKISEVKSLAEAVIKAIKKALDPDVVIAAWKEKLNETETEVAQDHAEATAMGFWTFGTTIDQFMARRVASGGITKNKLSPPSLREVKDRLRDRPEAAPLMTRFVKELRFENIEEVRDKIDASGGGESAGAKFTDLTKRVLKWGAKFRRRMTGLDPTYPWWLALAHEYKPGNRSQRFLTPAQAGMLIALLEGVRALEDRSNDAVFGALQLVWLIVQRSAALVGMESLKSDQWKDDPVPERAGWRVFTWIADNVKGKRVTKLSIPPIAIAVIERVAKNAQALTHIESNWAFPQARNIYLLRAYANSKNKDGICQFDKHVSSSALNHALDSLAGRKAGWPNLLQIVGLPDRIGPHDLRRSLTTFFENRGQGSYASALLDHKVTGTDKMSEQVAAVTQGVYSGADRVAFKAEGLVLWLAAVLPYYEKAKADPRLQAAIEARRASLEQNKKRGFEKRAATLVAKRTSMTFQRTRRPLES
jgi:hypothetical protein